MDIFNQKRAHFSRNYVMTLSIFAFQLITTTRTTLVLSHVRSGKKATGVGTHTHTREEG